MRKKQKHNRQEKQQNSHFPADGHNDTRKEQSRQHNKDKLELNNKKDAQQKHCLRTFSKRLLEGLNMLNGTNIALRSDVDQATSYEVASGVF